MTSETQEKSQPKSRTEPPPLLMAINRVNRLVISDGDLVFRFEFNPALKESEGDMIILENVAGCYRQEKSIAEAKDIGNHFREIVFYDVPQHSNYHLIQQTKNNSQPFYFFKDKNYYELFAAADDFELAKNTEFSDVNEEA